MLLSWQIRYLDTRDREFKDRHLWLETDQLDPVTRAAVEATYDMQESWHSREMVRFRHLFEEREQSKAELQDTFARHGRMDSFTIVDYVEDEMGKELSKNEVAKVLTGNPEALMLPAQAMQHDVDYLISPKPPIMIDEVALSDEQLGVLGYFARDPREMTASAFLKEGPGSLKRQGNSAVTLHTAVTDEEIRSFVTIFRRLYMVREPANFLKAVAAFSEATGDFPLTNWVCGVARAYEQDLQGKPTLVPIVGRSDWPFTRKRLIDVFLYTQYAHQPDEQRARQFQECLASADSQLPLLTWMFLKELRYCAGPMRSAGVIIARFYDRYCQHHDVSADVLASVSDANPGIGTREKKEERCERILQEKANELAEAMWQEKDPPPGGPTQFLDEARRQLEAAISAQAAASKEAS